MNNQENKMLTVYFLTILSYIVTVSITKEFVILAFSYFFFYLIYNKLYNYVFKKIVENQKK